MNLLFAPHVDDEVIGCFQLLRDPNSVTVVVYVGEMDEVRREEARSCGLYFRHKWSIARFEELTTLPILSQGVTTLWAPDPTFETHPHHKEVGALVCGLARSLNRRLVTYSTVMTAPYVCELSAEASQQKKSILTSLFPSQQELWRSDGKYYLFEGRSEWNPPL